MCYNFYLPVAINMSLFLFCTSFVLARPISLISYSFREWSFLIPVTWVEGIFEELKKFLSPGRIWQKVLVHQHDLLESFGTPTTKVNIAQNVFVPLLQLCSSFRTPDIEQKNSKVFNSFFK